MRENGSVCSACKARSTEFFSKSNLLPDQRNSLLLCESLGWFFFKLPTLRARHTHYVCVYAGFECLVGFYSQWEVRIDSLWVSIKQRTELRANKRWCCFSAYGAWSVCHWLNLALSWHSFQTFCNIFFNLFAYTNACVIVLCTTHTHFCKIKAQKYISTVQVCFEWMPWEETKVEANSCPRSFFWEKDCLFSWKLTEGKRVQPASILLVSVQEFWIFGRMKKQTQSK